MSDQSMPNHIDVPEEAWPEVTVLRRIYERDGTLYIEHDEDEVRKRVGLGHWEEMRYAPISIAAKAVQAERERLQFRLAALTRHVILASNGEREITVLRADDVRAALDQEGEGDAS